MLCCGGRWIIIVHGEAPPTSPEAPPTSPEGRLPIQREAFYSLTCKVSLSSPSGGVEGAGS